MWVNFPEVKTVIRENSTFPRKLHIYLDTELPRATTTNDISIHFQDGKNAKVIAFGVGPTIREEDLNEMAGEKNWFYVEDFLNMKERINDILEAACNETISNPVP